MSTDNLIRALRLHGVTVTQDGPRYHCRIPHHAHRDIVVDLVHRLQVAAGADRVRMEVEP